MCGCGFDRGGFVGDGMEWNGCMCYWVCRCVEGSRSGRVEGCLMGVDGMVVGNLC